MVDTNPKRGRPNWLGMWSLYVREVRRFAKIFGQTLLAPLVSTLLFLAIFGIVFGDVDRMVGRRRQSYNRILCTALK